MRLKLLKPLGLLLVQLTVNYAQNSFVLTPPYFNIAENRPITANATCGDGTNVQRPERYCKLVGFDKEEASFSNTNLDKEIVYGQVCDYCYAPDTEGVDVTKTHGPKNAVDGDISTWWQSPPISRGRKYNRVDLEIDLLQTFQVAYVVVTMADSPRPGVWALEKSMDGGKTWTAWQYFASNDVECQKYFGMHANMKLEADDDVICTTKFSKVLPIEGGEIFVPLIQGRPSETDIQSSETMMNWLRATNIRLRLMQTKTMLGHLMSVAQGDQSITRRYYYSIKEISVGGRCVCNGHAYVCPPSPQDPNILQCECLHNTIGLNCDKCAPGFTQKDWRRYTKSDRFECEPCNCNGHSEKCHYDQDVADRRMSMDIHGNYEGGGVCEECRDYTTGINCHSCIEGFFRQEGVLPNDTNPCIPCQCGEDPRYTGNCAAESGQCECKEAFRGAEDCSACAPGYYDYPNCKPCDCFPQGTMMDYTGSPVCVSEGGATCPCKENYGGDFCNECAPGYYNFPECTPCNCHPTNSKDSACDMVTGQCNCDLRYQGLTCEECMDGFFGYPECSSCNCDVQGTEEEICSKESGQCLCKEGYGGERCDRCRPGWYGYPDCKPCECSEQGSNSEVCDEVSGQCPCFNNYGGRRCDSCTPGYYSYPDCKMCGCNSFGSVGLSCDNNGHCNCLSNFMGIKCDQCAPDRFNFPLCEECNCDPKGVADDFFQRGGCGNVPKGELCTCKEKVTGRTCNQCKPLYWNLQKWRPDGCEACDCNRIGTIGGLGVCDINSGQCQCKPVVDGSRKCDACVDGFFSLSGNSLLGCEACGCDLGGTDYMPGETPVCDKDDGQCSCRYGMVGRTCNEVQPLHYVPSLYQNKFEIEDGYRLDGSLVRFAYDPAKFPDYSWRGYAAFSPLQTQVLQDISLTKSSLYQMVFRYQNPNGVPVAGTVKMSQDGDEAGSIFHKFVLEPTSGDPAFVTVSGETGVYPSPFDLEPGRWTVSVDVNNNDKDTEEVLIDYFVLLPNEYTEPRILKYDVSMPCLRDGSQDFCREYIYPLADMYPHADSTEAMNPSGAGFYPYTGRPQDLEDVGVDHVVQIANFQPELKWTNIKSRGGPHAIVLGYFTPDRIDGTSVGVSAGSGTPGEAYIYDCPYSMVCRQVVTDPEGRIAQFDLDRKDNTVSMRALSPDTNVAIDKIYLIPMRDWSPDFITPFSRCVKDRNGVCRVPNAFPVAPDGSAIIIPEVGTEQVESQGIPRFIANPEVPLMKIGGDFPSANMTGLVPEEGAYVIVAQYYQPDHPMVEAKVTVTDRQMDRPGGDQLPSDLLNVYEAVLPLPNCASSTGCRQPVQKGKDDKNPANFQLSETVDIRFETTGPNGGWIEYVLAVPAQDYDDSLLKADDTIDRRGEFIQECGKNSFYLPDNIDEGFCKDSIVSVSSDFNNGALQCDCDPEGSLSQYQCESFGGQCACKPNVIGRSCARCESGFFGFPDCKQCNCPSTATCNEETGECICAPFVTGTPELPCSKCEENTFGYDPITGCQECKCMVEGTIEGNMTCTQESGQCYCKENVEGRTCDHCSYGSYQYPYCQSCDCDTSGTTERICDQVTAQCLCKNYVGGDRCDTCLDGHFNLQDNNPDGCTECFCFGKTTFCSSKPNLVTVNFEDMDLWTGTSVKIGRLPQITDLNREPLINYGGILDMNFDNLMEVLASEVYYFSAPPSYAGSHIGSYGSNLFYKISSYGDPAQGSTKAPDIILKGGDSMIFYFSGRKMGTGEQMEVRAPLEPRYWLHPSGNPVSRPQLMVLLNSLERIYIRGSYGGTTSQQTRLENVVLEVTEDAAEANGAATGGSVLTVEQCVCPEGYTGSSCELCSPGYWSETSDKWGPICRRCNCHGHADTCHPQTGECKNYVPIEPQFEALPQIRLDFCHYYPEKCIEDTSTNHCRDNTRGRNCELCEVGFYGDATLGAPDSCRACPCPRPDNNFAESCDGLFYSTQPEEQVCVCQPNYVGDRCQHCGPGYFGNPEDLGGSCQPCNCNGNINVTDPEACNRVTGLCQVCLYNTFGESCERCEPWFFGDAIGAKDCQECDCNRDGTRECDHNTGQCQCFDGVEGERCDRCVADHFGFKFGGCTPCLCSEASVDTQCDLETGQCRCRPGVTGAKCNRCLNGYWNLGPEGCESCGCNTDFAVGGGCNQLTGQCECLPGVIGQNCDRCPPNWVLIMNETRAFIPEWKRPFDYDEGCFPCSSCVEDLMAATNDIVGSLGEIMDDFKEKEKSFFAFRRLNFIGNEIDRLKPEIALLDPAEGNRRIKPLEDEVNGLHWTAKSLNVDFKQKLMEDLSRQAEELSVDGSNAVAEMGEVGVKIMEVIKDVNDVSEYLAEGAPTKELLDTSIKTGRDLLASMQERNFSPVRESAVEERELARNLVERVKDWSNPVNVFKDSVKTTDDMLTVFEENLDDLHNQTLTAERMADRAQQGNFRNSAPQDKIERIDQLSTDAKAKKNLGWDMVNESEDFIAAAKSSFEDLGDRKDEMEQYQDQFNDRARTFDDERNDIFMLEADAASKAEDLTYQANRLKNVAEKSKQPAENALQAALAYEKILKSVTEAQSDVNDALSSANQAYMMSDGVSAKVNDALKEINVMYDDARDAEAAVLNALEPRLAVSKQQVSDVGEATKTIKQKLGTISKNLDKMGDLSGSIEDTKSEASTAQSNAHDALTSINARAAEISQNKEKAYVLRNEHSAMNLHLANTEKALNDYIESPRREKRDAYQDDDINQRLKRLEERKEYMLGTGNRVNDLVGSIREKISSARDALAQIENPGVTFTRGSNLEIQTPGFVEDMALTTDVSFYVNISNSGDDNERDFLFYMGNLEETYKKIPNVLTDDYMALQVGKDGYVTLTMDVGAGPLELVSATPILYNDWVKIGVERRGAAVNLTLSTEKEIGNVESESVSGFLPPLDEKGKPFGSAFNLHREYTRIFVGGFPTEQKVQRKITSTDMEGQIEGLMIGGKPVGLWNLKNSDRISGASARNKFGSQKANEARLSGDGYISLDPTIYFTEGSRSDISLRMKPEKPDGMILLMQNQDGDQFLSVDIQEGRLSFRFRVGGTVSEISSPDQLEMNRWYNVKLDRQGTYGAVTIDGATVARSDTMENEAAEFGMMTSLFVGGMPDISLYPVPAMVGYTGCIAGVKIEPDHVDLEKNMDASNVSPTCQVQAKNTLSFLEGNPGYAQMPNVQTDGTLHFSFMFRTATMHGLLFYMVDTTNMFYVSLSMLDGALHLYAHPNNELITTDSKGMPTRFNDNKWHVVTATILQYPENKIILHIDDYYIVAPHNVQNIPLVQAGTEYSVYYGGLPEKLRPLMNGVSAHEGPFIGCIRDAIVAGQYQDFQGAVAVTGASLGECGSTDLVTITATESTAAVEEPTLIEEAEEPGVDDFNPIDFLTENINTAPEVYGQCKLPPSPAFDADLTAESGMRFGMKGDSYIHYIKKNLPEMMREKSRFDMEFKTSHEDGMILYMKNDDNSEFFALFIQGGKLVFSFDCGSGPSRLETDFRIDDGQWHTLDISRIQNDGKLVLDSREVKVSELKEFAFSETKIMTVNQNLYLGGLDNQLKRDIDLRSKLGFPNSIPGFIGCLRKVRFEVTRNNKRRMRSLGKWQKNNHVIPCSDKVEPGFFFGPEGGRIKAFRRYRVGIDFDVSMMIKPRNITGLLLAVRGRRDSAILQMVDGAIQFMVNNGRGPISATFKPDDRYQFCNGEWHEIHAVKAKNVVTLSVNKIFAQPGIGVPGVSSTDTNNPLFIGGHPYPNRLNLDTYAPFVGCMRGVEVESDPLIIEDHMLYGDIHSHVCPTI